MRNIAKGTEPSCLTKHRGTPHASYDNLPTGCKDELKRRMWKEQGGLCCYCMSRVTAESGHIEHWHPQSRSRDEGDKRELEYANLLLACDGGANGGYLHCDASKGSKLLKFNPANPRHDVESRIQYFLDGRIECHGDVEFNGQLHDVLHLNAPYLIAARKKVIEVAQKFMRRCGLSELNQMKRKFSQPGNDDELPQYCMVVIYFIEKQIRKKAALRKNAGRK